MAMSMHRKCAACFAVLVLLGLAVSAARADEPVVRVSPVGPVADGVVRVMVRVLPEDAPAARARMVVTAVDSGDVVGQGPANQWGEYEFAIPEGQSGSLEIRAFLWNDVSGAYLLSPGEYLEPRPLPQVPELIRPDELIPREPPPEGR